MYALKILAAAQKDLNRLPNASFNTLKSKILSLAGNPRPHGSRKLTNEGGYRIRAGDYRVLYRVDDKTQEIYVYRVKHRKDAYR